MPKKVTHSAKKKSVKRVRAKKTAVKKVTRATKALLRKIPLQSGHPKLSKTKANKAKPKPLEVVEGTLLGKVEDYFAHVGVAALTLKSALMVGDTIRIKGHTTDLLVKVESLQMEQQPVTVANPGDGVGIKIPDRARRGDRVYRI